MRNFYVRIMAIAAMLAVAFGVYAFARRPQAVAPGDDIIIKGGSMTIQCGANHNKDCLSHTSGTYVYTHKKTGAHITNITVKDYTGAVLYTGAFPNATQQPEIDVTFK